MFNLLLSEASPLALASQLRVLAVSAEESLMPLPHLASLYGNEAVLRWCLTRNHNDDSTKLQKRKRNSTQSSVDESSLPGTRTAADGTLPSLFNVASDRDRMGATALHYAALGGHLSCVKLLVEEAHALPEAFFATSQVSQQQQEQAVGIDGKTDVSSVIAGAIANGSTTLSSGNSSKLDGATPLHLACRVGARDVVDYLYQQWLADQRPHHRSGGPTSSKNNNNNKKVGQRSPAPPVNGRGETPLSYAIEGGHTDLVRHLIGPSAPSESQATKNGHHHDGDLDDAEPGLGWPIPMKAAHTNALLTLAVSMGFVDIARLLITEVKRRDNRKLKAFVTQGEAGSQPLTCACYLGSYECTDLLLSLRDDVTGSCPSSSFHP
jgi:ankyrin repeat protein